MKQNPFTLCPSAMLKLMPHLRLFMLAVCLCAPPHQSYGQTSNPGNDDDNWEKITVWAVSGYNEQGNRIGIDWYESQGEAQAAAEKMRAMEVTNGKFYAKVEVTSEQELVRKKKNLPPRENRPPDEPLSGPKKPAFIVPRRVELPSMRLDGQTKNPNSVAGKKGPAKIDGAKFEFEFAKDGTFVIRDPDANYRVLTKGEWSQTGTAVSIRTENFLYMGTVKGDVLNGKRVQRGTGKDVHEWSVTFGNIEETFVGSWDGFADAGPVSTSDRGYTNAPIGLYFYADGRANGNFGGSDATLKWYLKGDEVHFVCIPAPGGLEWAKTIYHLVFSRQGDTLTLISDKSVSGTNPYTGTSMHNKYTRMVLKKGH